MLKNDVLEKFWDYVNERHAIHVRRHILNRDPPWTKDKILQEYKFTNVFRELDKGTVFYLDEIMPHCKTPKQLFLNTVLYRVLINIETMQELGVLDLKTPKEKVMEILIKRKNRGDKIFTAAYKLCPLKEYKMYNTKVERYVHAVFEMMKSWHDDFVNFDIQEMFLAIKKHYGFGGFLAYEIVSDLAYSNLFPKVRADDWANAGPGAKRGLKHLFEKCNLTDMQKMRMLQQTQKQYFIFNLKLDLRNIEHNLCEFDKYYRTVLGTGKPKQRYTYDN